MVQYTNFEKKSTWNSASKEAEVMKEETIKKNKISLTTTGADVKLKPFMKKYLF